MKHLLLLSMIAGLGVCFPEGSRNKGVAALTNVPSFHWDATETSAHGIPHLVVSFGDGKPDDVLLLEPNTNLGVSDDAKKCFFQGRMKNEPGVFAALNGCPMDDSFQLLMNSKRHFARSFISVNGQVQPEIDDEERSADWCLTKDEVSPKQLPFDVSLGGGIAQGKEGTVLPAEFSVTMSFSYDNTWKAKFGDKSADKAREIINLGQTMMHWGKIGDVTEINFDVKEIRHLPIYLEVTDDALEEMEGKSDQNPLDVNAYVYLCALAPDRGTVGIADFGTVCSEKALRTSLVGWHESDKFTAQSVVHELGHNLGMKHDFNGEPGEPRLDKEGKTCTNIHALMDYNQDYYDKWSMCSLEDFEGLYNKVLNDQGSFCLKSSK